MSHNLPTPFCEGHTQSWAGSPERREVDFSSDESYAAQIQAFTTRFKSEPIKAVEDE